MNLKKKITSLPLLPLHISGMLSLFVLVAVTVWSHLSPTQSGMKSRDISSVYLASVDDGEHELPKRFRKNPAFKLFMKIEKAVDRQ